MNKKLQPVKNKKNQPKKKITVFNIKRKSLWLKMIFGFLVLLFLVVLTYHLAYWQKIYPGVKILNYKVGNQTISQAIDFLKKQPHFQQNPNALDFFNEKQNWQIDLQTSNFSYNLEKTSQKAFQVGRSGKTLADLKTKFKLWFQEENLSLDYNLDQNSLENQIASIAAQVFVPAIEPTIKINPPTVNPRIAIESGKDGQELDKRQTLSLISNHLAKVDFNSIELPLIKTSPTLSEEEVKNTQQRAEKFLGKNLIITSEENQWELKENDLIGFLSFTNGFDQEKTASWSANLATTVNRLPENAAFQFTEGKVTEFRPAKDGLNLDQKKTVDLIAQSMQAIEKGETPQEIKLPLTKTPPLIKTAEVNNLGIKELVGRGVSYFQGSIPNRIHNIQLATSRLNGLLIPPGETFSFNKNLGDVSASTGYKEAYIIKEGRTILGDGGGVCQTSTTLFRAALEAGLPIVERKAHAYRVTYYEQNSSPGLDATVFDPSADLKIKNDTPAHLLLQANFDASKKMLVYELYGTNDGRKVTLTTPKVWALTPPPPALYQDDPTLSQGTVKQIDWQAWGAKVAFDYLVERNNEVLQKQTFYSNYRAWQSVFLRGTKQ